MQQSTSLLRHPLSVKMENNKVILIKTKYFMRLEHEELRCGERLL
jgi:hypothetical protein